LNLYAIFLGIDEYDDREIEPLRSAVLDAKELYGYFKHGLGLGDRAVHLEAGSHLREVNAAIERIGQTIRAGDQFLFYFAGHGYEWPGDQLLLLAGAKRQRVERGSTAGVELLSLKTLRDETEAWTGVRSLFVLDACRSAIDPSRARSVGGNAATFGNEKVLHQLVAQKLVARGPGYQPQSTDSYRCMVLNACADGEAAYEPNDGQGSILRHALEAEIARQLRQTQRIIIDEHTPEQLLAHIRLRAGGAVPQTPKLMPRQARFELYRSAMGGAIGSAIGGAPAPAATPAKYPSAAPTPAAQPQHRADAPLASGGGSLLKRAQQAMQEEQELWAEAQRQDSEAGYTMYLKYSEMKAQEAEATARRDALRRNREAAAAGAAQAKETALWQAAEREDSEASYAKYLESTTLKHHEAEARRRLGERRQARMAAEEAARRQREAEEAKARQAARYAPLAVFRDRLRTAGGEGPEMVVIPPGRFTMGSPPSEEGRTSNEGPQQEITIAKPFALGKYAVTFDEWDAYLRATGVQDSSDDCGWGRGRRPVIGVGWKDVRGYCGWLSEETGEDYHLPSEAKWEYACRAGTTTPFHYGETISAKQANYDSNHVYGKGQKGEYREKTIEVGSLNAPNAWGLHDMHGNVWEWCEDGWNDSLSGQPANSAAREADEKKYADNPVLRGGSCTDNPHKLRAAFRDWLPAVYRFNFFGFRVVRTVNF